MRLAHLSLRALCLGLLALVLVSGSALAEEPRWGRLYTIASGNIPVRENPSDTALKVRVLKAGQKIRVDFQDAGWAAVFDPKESQRSELKAWGYARVDELQLHGSPVLAQATSIEVRKPRPDAPPEVVVNGKPEKPAKAEVKPAAKPAAKAETKAGGKAELKSPKGFGEIRLADRSLTVRAKRDKDSEFKRLLRPGQPVRVDFLEDGWFAVFDPQEKTRDLSEAWGYSRDKYLVPEGAYSGPPYEAAPAAPAPAAPAPATPAKAQQPSKGEPQKAKSAEDPDVGYAVVERKEDRKKPPTVTLRVRLDLVQPPAPEALRKIVREIWKAERKKNENLQLEVLLNGMDAHGLAYATARFHDDGRLREFWWRDVVLKPKK